MQWTCTGGRHESWSWRQEKGNVSWRMFVLVAQAQPTATQRNRNLAVALTSQLTPRMLCYIHLWMSALNPHFALFYKERLEGWKELFQASSQPEPYVRISLPGSCPGMRFGWKMWSRSCPLWWWPTSQLQQMWVSKQQLTACGSLFSGCNQWVDLETQSLLAAPWLLLLRHSQSEMSAVVSVSCTGPWEIETSWMAVTNSCG